MVNLEVDGSNILISRRADDDVSGTVGCPPQGDLSGVYVCHGAYVLYSRIPVLDIPPVIDQLTWFSLTVTEGPVVKKIDR
jgi:hypothetical protein